MKISTRFIVSISFVVGVFSLGLVYAQRFFIDELSADQQKSFEAFAEDVFLNEAKSREKAIIDGFRQLGQKALGEASFFSRLPEIQEIYRFCATGNMDDETDPVVQEGRQRLRGFMKPFIKGYCTQTGSEFFKIHFHLPDSRSLSRLWRDGWQVKRDGQKLDVSDDLSSFRKTVVEINQPPHKPIVGIEVGEAGFALRGISPVTAENGGHLGSCEVLVLFEDVIEANHVDSSYEIAVYLKSEFLPIAKDLQDSVRFPVLDGKYVFTSSTARAITDPVISSALLARGEKKSCFEVLGGKMVYVFPVNDYRGAVVGVMALVYDLAKVNFTRNAFIEAGQRAVSHISSKFVAGTILVLLIVIFILKILINRILGPLYGLVKLANQVAIGDLTEELNFTSKDEIGDLVKSINLMIQSLRLKENEAREIASGNLGIEVKVQSEKDSMGAAFRTMVKNLNEILGKIKEVVNKINIESNALKDCSVSLSNQAIESASSIEEISSSMHEIDGQSQQNSSNATGAIDLVNQTKLLSEKGLIKMKEMNAAINSIHESGQNVKKIIKVIDDIAFQTNLLALNAAVESARAGRHGKGFAVVSEEVRNLAARSANAAKETSDLLEESFRYANSSVEIVQKTSLSFDEINASVQKVAVLVEEIVIASKEQSTGVSMITQGLSQVDQSVQSVSAISEETSSAAEELAEKAKELSRLLERFRFS